MANDNMFTRKDGTRVPVPSITLPDHIVTSIMRAQEDLQSKGKHSSLAAIALDWILTGRDTLERRAKNAQKNKENRNTGKAVKEYIRVQLILRKKIDPLVIAELSGVQMPSNDEGDTLEGDGTLDSLDLTDEQLEAATDPQGHVA